MLAYFKNNLNIFNSLYIQLFIHEFINYLTGLIAVHFYFIYFYLVECLYQNLFLYFNQKAF